MSGVGIVLLTTFLASSVEAIEMVTIVIGVGVTRGIRLGGAPRRAERGAERRADKQPGPPLRALPVSLDTVR
jgi:hypothetical protein